MKMSYRQHNLNRKKLHLFLGKALNSNQVLQKLTSLHELHQKVDSEFVLENILHIDEKRVCHRIEDVSLVQYVL